MSTKKTLTGSIALTALTHVKMKMKGKSGEVEGMFIPFEANKLVLGAEKDGNIPVYMPIRFMYNSEKDQYGQNGFLAKSVSKEVYQAADTDEKKAELQKYQPILGNLMEHTGGGNASDTAGAVSNQTYTPDDDLPF